MKKLLAIPFVCLLLAFSSNAQDHSNVDRAVDKFRNYFNNSQTDSMYEMMSARIKQLMTPDKVKAMVGQLHEKLGTITACEYVKKEDKLVYYTTTFTSSKLTLIASVDSVGKMDVFRFIPYQPDQKSEPEADATDYNVTSDSVTLHGTLTMPKAKGKVPVVLIIAGSGPTDRNCNSGAGLVTNAYRMLADSLHDAGVACVRYDKRGIGQSKVKSFKEGDVTMNVMVKDARTFIDALNKDSRFSGVYIVGHSEGSLVGMLAAQKGGVKKYVSVSGAGERLDNVLRMQLASKSPEVKKNADEIMDSLIKGYDVQNINPELSMLFRPSIQPYVRSLLSYDPAKEISKLKIPVMIVQGEKDIQVATRQADLLKKGKSNARLAIFPHMNHVLKDVGDDMASNNAAYQDGNKPLTPGLSRAIVSFIEK